MVLQVKKDSDNEWGFVENFSLYKYGDTGNITITGVVTPEGKLSTPYVLRGNTYIPLKTIEEEMGIEKYIKAKKPFYSRLSDGFIVQIKAGVNFDTGEFLEDKTSYVVYRVLRRKESTSGNANSCELELGRILEVTSELKELMLKLAKEVVLCKGDRELYLRSRL